MLKNLIKNGLVQWEKFICNIKKIQPITGSDYSLLWIRTSKHKGETLILSDNSFLNKGDCIIEIHLSNIVLAKGRVGNATVASDLQLMPYVRWELYTLGNNLQSQPIDSSIKAIGGVTLHGPGMRRLGFSLYPGHRNLYNALVSIWMRILRWEFSRPKEVVRLKKRPPRYLEHFYMPTSQFMQKYGTKSHN